MGFAMLRGWLGAGMAPESITVLDPAPAAALTEAAANGVVLNCMPASHPETIVLAVKPQKVGEIVKTLAVLAGPDTLVISVMAGKTISDLRKLCPGTNAFVRAMPNLPAQVGNGMTVAFAAPQTAAAQRACASELLGACGQLEWLETEDWMNAATGVSGSGPAYLFYIAECLTVAGIAQGLPAPLAERLARATISGAGALLSLDSRAAAQLRADVTSPAGTTEAGLRILMDDGILQRLITDTVAAAGARACELAG
jgi:pyrroline-5-carboxylate reductase